MLWQWIVLCWMFNFYWFQFTCGFSSVTVSHSVFSNISIQGLFHINVENIPLGSQFILYQLHSPLYQLFVSTSLNFDYNNSIIAYHSGLIGRINNETKSTFYVFSEYDFPIQTWIKATAYDPVPGGCGKDAAVGTEIMTKNLNCNTSSLLSYWTSAVNFKASALIYENGTVFCPEPNNSNLTYDVYALPLVTAGNPFKVSVKDVGAALEEMSDYQVEKFKTKHVYTYTTHKDIIEMNYKINLLVARRPSTIYVITVVVKYLTPDSLSGIAYAPVLLFGCLLETSSQCKNTFCDSTDNIFTLDCGLLPKDIPLIYFPVAVILLASLVYATSCHLCVWPRCAVSIMVFFSVVGMIFFYRYSSDVKQTYAILLISTLLPAIISLIIFIILWWYCIRPTLYYRRVYGRGPLVRVENGRLNQLNQWWNYGFFGLVNPQTEIEVRDDVPIYTNHASNVTSAIVEEHPRNLFKQMSSLVNENDEYQNNSAAFYIPSITEYASQPLGCHDNYVGADSMSTHMRQSIASNQNQDATVRSNDDGGGGGGVGDGDDENYYINIFGFCCWKKPFKSKRLFSLKPRRVARLPPILPATFIFVAFLYFTLERFLALNASAASFFAFVFFASVCTLGLLSIFKNFAFGFSTAFVGFYVSFSCVCLFLIPNAMLPHIVIDYFLMFTWFEVRLRTLRIDSYGPYDVVLFVLWFVASLVFGLIALCLIRLRDASELAEAQHYEAMHMTSEFHLLRSNANTSSSLLMNRLGSIWHKIRSTTNRNYRQVSVSRLHPASTLEHAESSILLPSTSGVNQVSSQHGANQLDNFNCMDSAQLERQYLISGNYTSYGGLASTASRQLLMPLSKVQLANRTNPMGSVPSSHYVRSNQSVADDGTLKSEN